MQKSRRSSAHNAEWRLVFKLIEIDAAAAAASAVEVDHESIWFGNWWLMLRFRKLEEVVQVEQSLFGKATAILF
jgi:hypothetical protein